MFWPFSKKVEDHLNETKLVKIHGMKFQVKRVNVLDFCTGAKVVSAIYDTYKVGKLPSEETAISKIKEYYINILMAGIVYPELSRKIEDGKLFVENLLTDWDLAGKLVENIMLFTYGKKNFKQFISQEKSY